MLELVIFVGTMAILAYFFHDEPHKAFFILYGILVCWYAFAYATGIASGTSFILSVFAPPAIMGVLYGATLLVTRQGEPPHEEPKPTPPEPAPLPRFEHTHVLGAPGAGKTELLKKLISEDIETNAAIIVMAPKGNLIRSIAKLTKVDADRLILVEPDEKYPVGLNVFDLEDSGQAVSLLNYVFNSILDADTTNKQTALLNYCVRLLLKAPSTILDLRDLLGADKLPVKYHPYVSQLSDSGQHFFKEQFGSITYKETKGQIKWRLDLLLENPLIEKMFSSPETMISLKDVMAGGKILLIDTSIKELGEYGSSFFGRFFIALIALAAQQRDTNRALRAVYVYIDEASTYLTDYIESLLDRARESKVGLTLAHQHLKQLSDVSPKLEASIHNTAIKYVGRVNDHDAKKMAAEMRLNPETLHAQPPLHFTRFVRGSNTTVRVEPGYLEHLPQRTDREMHQLIARNRERVSSPRPAPPTKSPDDDGTKPSSEW